jgi:copper chaperone CopZ
MCTACGCRTENNTTTSIPSGTENPESYTVTGMTCGHCVSSVTEEVSAIDGVSDVAVDLATGSLTFTSDRPVSPDAVEAAVREAGYSLA